MLRFRYLLCLALIGCSANIKHTTPEPPSVAATKPEGCYQRNRMQVTEGHAEFEQNDGMTRYIHTTDGLSFYKRGNRLSPARAFAILGDKRMEKEFARRRAQLDRPSGVYGIRAAAGGLLGVGGLSALAIGVGPGIDEADRGLAIAGLGVALVGLIVGLTYYPKWKKSHGTHQVYSQLLIDGHFSKRLDHALRAHNRAVAERCGYDVVRVPLP